MKTSRREFLGSMAVSPILLGMQDKAGSKAPIMGSGAYTFEAIHDWGVLPPQIKWGNTHGVVEDAQGHIYVHHTVHATSDSADTVVVFDANGKFVRSWGKEFRGVAHGLWLRKEGRDEFLYLTVNATNPKMSPQPQLQAVLVKTTLDGRDRVEDRGAAGLRGLPPWTRRGGEALQPDERRDRAERRHLRGRWLRFVLRESVFEQGRVHPLVRRPGRRTGTARRATRHLGRHPRQQSRSGRGRPPQQPPAALHAWTGSTSTSSPASGCPATSTSVRAWS